MFHVIRPRQLFACSLALVAAAVMSGCGAGDVDAGVEVVDLPAALTPGGASRAKDDAEDPAATTDPAEIDAVIPSRPRTVAVVGDSLTVSAEDEIRAAFADAGIEVIGFDGRESRRTVRATTDLPSGVDAVTALQAFVEPDLWVIALGTNDVGGQESPEEFRSDVDELLALLPEEVPAIWLDVWVKSRVEACIEANGVLREAAADRPGLSVVDWFQYGDDPGMILGDGVHLTDDGQQKFAAVMIAEIDARFGPD